MSLLQDLREKKEVVERLREKNLLSEEDIELLQALHILKSLKGGVKGIGKNRNLPKPFKK